MDPRQRPHSTAQPVLNVNEKEKVKEKEKEKKKEEIIPQAEEELKERLAKRAYWAARFPSNHKAV